MKLLNIRHNDSDSAPEKIADSLKDSCLNEECMLPVFDEENIKKEEIGEKLITSLDEADKVVSVSGNHSISIPLIKSFVKKYPNAGIVVFDAHPDCRDEEDLLPALVKAGIKRENIILVGTRSWKKEEHGFLSRNRIRMFEMRKIVEFGERDIIETIMETARKFQALYVSVDLDVLDPCFAPAVDAYEPGGMSSRDLLFFLSRLKKLQNLKALDIMELRPEKDINGMTAKLAAKIVREMC